MVVLNWIYICIGDKGEIVLLNGDCVVKYVLCVEVYGIVDEVNVMLGLVCLYVSGDMVSCIVVIQNDLFDLGVDLLCLWMQEDDVVFYLVLCIIDMQVDCFEVEIDVMNVNLLLLCSFILFGGSVFLVYLYLVCMVMCCVECCVVVLVVFEDVNFVVICYLNWLFDWFFVVSCIVNENGVQDVFWVSGVS